MGDNEETRLRLETAPGGRSFGAAARLHIFGTSCDSPRTASCSPLAGTGSVAPPPEIPLQEAAVGGRAVTTARARVASPEAARAPALLLESAPVGGSATFHPNRRCANDSLNSFQVSFLLLTRDLFSCFNTHNIVNQANPRTAQILFEYLSLMFL